MGADGTTQAGGELASVPVIDISGYFTGSAEAKHQIARAIDEACRTIGFVVVSGHGVPDALVEQMRRTLRTFFSLPDNVKRRYGSPSPDIHRGYYAVGSNNVSYTLDDHTAQPDFREFFTGNRVEIDPADPYYSSPQGRRIFAPNIWPDSVDGFREVWTDYYKAMEQLATALMRLFALALDLDEHWFDDKIDKHMTNLTVSHYPDQPEPPPPGQLRAGAHTDYGSLTILCTEDKPGGLEVQTAAGEWKKVPIVPGTFIINLGDLMARWTNDRWVSTMHRVVNPPRDKAIGSSRLSLTFFHQPNYDAVVECLPSFKGAGPAKYPRITSGEHLLSKLGKMRSVATDGSTAAARV
jgi:isopenicillin N synthase-like dioxygenase